MSANPSTRLLARLLNRLDESKRSFSAQERVVIERTLKALARRRFPDADSLVRYHEALLFLRAYPQSQKLLKLAEAELASFARRVKQLIDAEVDLTPLSYPDTSGIAGTSVTDSFSYYIVRWLVRTQQGRVALDADWVDDENRLAATWPRFMPLLEEDALVEANVPYRKWLESATPRGEREVSWLIKRFESLPLDDKGKAELYDSLQLYIRWRPAYRATRTGMRLPVRSAFYHEEPLIKRKDVSLAAELQKPSLPFKRLSQSEGQKILNLARETSSSRYRELYGFTHGDPARVLKVSLGRGTDLFIVGVPAAKRLPLRAYHAAMIFKNGIAVGYFEGLSICERMEGGFNFYYTFREGETAWIYARTLSVFKQLLGVTTFSIDPYQIGHENEEGIESGAYWFYRKLGFRSTQNDLLKLAQQEEKKIETRSGYRTAARTLRKLATGYLIYESLAEDRGAWDHFQVRKIGLAVQRRMARELKGDAEQLRDRSLQEVTRVMDLHLADWEPEELRAFRELAPALSLIPNLKRWTKSEKDQLAEVIRAKAGPDESNYLRLLQRHPRLRKAIIEIGS
ncbi:MAG: hypothetical protein M3R68_04280 [Acidobacteriota bacterium]|nr:hypothetical protein [Acidobacteriota bacterium]